MASKKSDKVFRHLIDKQFELAGIEITFDDVVGQPDWYDKYTMTCEQSRDFRSYGIDYIRKQLRVRKEKARSEMDWFCLAYSLKLSDPDNFKLIFDEQDK